MNPSQPPSRKSHILDTLADMLGQPQPARVTTAALAERLSLSEAALYRHFDSKAAIFNALITRIETQLLDDLNHIHATEPAPHQQLRKQVHALLLFPERHPGLARILTGHALVTEDPRLQTRVSTLITQFEALLYRSAVQTAAPPQALSPDDHAKQRANLLITWISGRWLHYAQTNWAIPPTHDLAEQLSMLDL